MRWSDYSSLGLLSKVSSWSSTSAKRSGVLQGNKTAVREADALWTRAASVVLRGIPLPYHEERPSKPRTQILQNCEVTGSLPHHLAR